MEKRFGFSQERGTKMYFLTCKFKKRVKFNYILPFHPIVDKKKTTRNYNN